MSYFELATSICMLVQHLYAGAAFVSWHCNQQCTGGWWAQVDEVVEESVGDNELLFFKVDLKRHCNLCFSFFVSRFSVSSLNQALWSTAPKVRFSC
jgi:hypothetical protein